MLSWSAVPLLPGRETAKKVKEAGRGSHVTLGFLGNEYTRSSGYKQDYCKTAGSDASSKSSAPQERPERAQMVRDSLHAWASWLAGKGGGGRA